MPTTKKMKQTRQYWRIPKQIHTAEPKAPAPAPTPQTDDQRYQADLADYKSRAEKLNAVFSFFEDGHRLQMFEYFQLIMDRDHGCNTPVEEFITNIIIRYGWADRGSRGLTVENIEKELETLRENLSDAVRDSHFIASRYKTEDGQA